MAHKGTEKMMKNLANVKICHQSLNEFIYVSFYLKYTRMFQPYTLWDEHC